eukprot:3189368-Rhodomonas_salina.1
MYPGATKPLPMVRMLLKKFTPDTVTTWLKPVERYGFDVQREMTNKVADDGVDENAVLSWRASALVCETILEVSTSFVVPMLPSRSTGRTTSVVLDPDASTPRREPRNSLYASSTVTKTPPVSNAYPRYNAVLPPPVAADATRELPPCTLPDVMYSPSRQDSYGGATG